MSKSEFYPVKTVLPVGLFFKKSSSFCQITAGVWFFFCEKGALNKVSCAFTH